MGRMRRRNFLALVGSVAAMLVLSSGASAQEAGRTYRLGVLTMTTRTVEGFQEGFRDITLPELAKYGFIEGRNLILDMRIGSADELPGLARQLAASKPDVILAVSDLAIQAIKEA